MVDVSSTNGDFSLQMFPRKVLLLLGSLVTLLILPLYQNGLLTHLLLARVNKPFESADQLVNLVARGTYKMIFNDLASGFYVDMMHDNSSEFRKRLRNAIKLNPIVVEGNVSRAMELVQQGNHILVITPFRGFYLKANYCDVIAARVPDVGVSQQGFIFQKNFSLLPKIDEAIRHSLDYLLFLYRKYEMALASSCGSARLKQRPLGLNSLSGVFIQILHHIPRARKVKRLTQGDLE